MKACTKCGQCLPLSEFNANGGGKLQARCRTCQHEDPKKARFIKTRVVPYGAREQAIHRATEERAAEIDLAVAAMLDRFINEPAQAGLCISCDTPLQVPDARLCSDCKGITRTTERSQP